MVRNQETGIQQSQMSWGKSPMVQLPMSAEARVHRTGFEEPLGLAEKQRQRESRQFAMESKVRSPAVQKDSKKPV